MPFKLQSLAKVALLTALLASAGGVYLAQQWERTTASSTASANKAREDVRRLRASLAEFDAIPAATTVEGTATPVSQALPAFMLEVFNARVAYGITLTNAGPVKSTSSQMPEVGSLLEQVPDSSLVFVPIKLTGVYKSYDEFQGYLRHLQKMPIAVTNLKVQEQTFELVLTLYGLKDKS